MKRKLITLAACAAAPIVLLLAPTAQAQPKKLTICWAEWDPAHALETLSKDFSAKSGIAVNLELQPWVSFADRFMGELSAKHTPCDLLIGDSQWIGSAAEAGHYVKLNDFFDRNGIKMEDFAPGSVRGYSEWPKKTPNYYALPAMGDAVGWTYRRDWFRRPELRAEFFKKYNRRLRAPRTLDELKEVAQFFQGRVIDGKTVYGLYLFTERGSEGITMGVTNVLYDYGFEYDNPGKPYETQGFVNSAQAIEGLKFYKSLYDCCTAPHQTNSYMREGVEAFKSGLVAMQMNWFAFFPGLYRDPVVGGSKIGFFANPAGKKHFTQLGGQGISVVSYSPNREAALQYIKWFAQPDVQKRWWALGGYSCHKAVLSDPSFPASQPFARAFLNSIQMVKDFWAEPSYGALLTAMQTRIHNYVVAGTGTAKEALDGLVSDWEKILKARGKIATR